MTAPCRATLAVVALLLALLLAPPPAAAQADIEVDPPAVDFGTVAVGETATAQITVTNTGNASLQIQAVSAMLGPVFSLPVPGSFPIGPGQFWNVTVSFRPAAAGPAAGSVRIQSSDPDEGVVVVPLSGIGGAPATPVPTVTPPPDPTPAPTPTPIPTAPPDPGSIGFSVDVTPATVRVVPGRTARVRYRIRETAGQDTLLFSRDPRVDLPDGSTLVLGGQPIERRLAAGATIVIDGSVLLPEAAREVLARAGPAAFAVFQRTFSGQTPGASAEQEVSVTLVPSGPLAADFDITTIAIEFPVAGALVPLGSEIRARAILYGNGSGSTLGRWLVDGVPIESFFADLTGGTRVVVETLLPLPSAIPGTHRLELELSDPRALRSRPVRYLVTQAPLGRLRFTLPPGFRSYLRAGALPNWAWTPRPAALHYRVRIDDGPELATTEPAFTLAPEQRAALAAGTHRIAIRPVLAVSDGGPRLDDDVLVAEFRMLDAPETIAASCDRSCRWPRAPEGGIYAVVIADAEDRVVYNRLTTRDAIEPAELEALAPAAPGLKLRVEQRNDHGERVGLSPWIALPGTTTP